MTGDQELRVATLARLELLERFVASAVADMSPGPTDPLAGMFISEAQVQRLLAGRPESAGDLGRLDAVLSGWGRHVGIDDVDVDLLVVAAAPDIDHRFERLFGYLNDDATLRRATTGLALRLAACDATRPEFRARLSDDAPLVRLGLVEIEERGRPFLTRSLRVPDRVVMALLGDDRPVAGVRLVQRAEILNDWVEQLADAVQARSGVLIHIRDRPERTGAALAASAVVEADGEVVVVDLGSEPTRSQDVLTTAIREAVLRGCGLVIEGIEPVLVARPELLDRLAALPRAVVLVGRSPWEPDWSTHVPLVFDAPSLDPLEQMCAWRLAIGSRGQLMDVEAVTGAFRLGPDRIRRAVAAARLAADHRGDELSAADLQWGARQQNGSNLRRLARRIEPVATWSDLVLQTDVTAAVREVVSRVRNRSFVMGDWQLRRGGGRGEGITALFAGPSGTGKTLAAEVIAHELGVDLHTVDLATVVDKYIGETEKNLDRIFNEAEQVNTVLFFDEADALFGKRSEVRDARDRYANVEVAYLLQRMERFDGAAILATNLRLNIDEAFARRLDLIVEFERPTSEERRRLWEVITGRGLPLGADVDFDVLAGSFDLAGGDIRNAVTTAAYLAAERGDQVEMGDLVKGVAREYRKLGRLCLPHEFGQWFAVIDADADAAPARHG